MKTKYQNNRSRTAIVVLAGLVASLLLPSCRHVSYTTYQGTGPMQGTGGTVRSLDGIEIWENGTPNRRYTILGVSDQERSGRNEKYDKELCKLAQKHGGNAVIILTENTGGRGIVKAQIVRYAP